MDTFSVQKIKSAKVPYWVDNKMNLHEYNYISFSKSMKYYLLKLLDFQKCSITFKMND